MRTVMNWKVGGGGDADGGDEGDGEWIEAAARERSWRCSEKAPCSAGGC